MSFSIKEGRQIDRYPDSGYEGERAAEERRRKASEREFLRVARDGPLRQPEVIRLWLEADVMLAGFSLADVLTIVKRGRMPADARARYDALALGVARLREKGAKLTTIGEAIGKGPQTVSNLEARGLDLLEARERELIAAEGERIKKLHCPRHDEFHADCPACVRLAPDRAVQYRHQPWRVPLGTGLAAFRDE
jgi:hypothetical protein